MAEYVTALELSKHIHEGKLVPLIQALSQQMEMYGDANFEAANDGSGHIGTTESSQPTGNYRAFNEGIATEAPTSVEFREPLVMLDGRFQADRALLIKKARGDGALAGTLRARMLGQYIVGMLKNHMTEIIYGTRSAGKSPRGLFVRSDLNTLTSSYVHDNAGGAASATANKTSIVIIGWGPEKYTWIYPQNESPAGGMIDQPGSPISGVGVMVEALPDDWVADASGTATNQFMAVRNNLNLHIAHAVMDARYVQRMCNISTTNIDGVDDFSFDEEVLIDMLENMPDLDNTVMYCNKTLRAQIRKRINEKGNVWHEVTDPFGRVVPGIDNVPLHIIENMTSTEATVT
jgi:hypothetical protein